MNVVFLEKNINIPCNIEIPKYTRLSAYYTNNVKDKLQLEKKNKEEDILLEEHRKVREIEESQNDITNVKEEDTIDNQDTFENEKEVSDIICHQHMQREENDYVIIDEKSFDNPKEVANSNILNDQENIKREDKEYVILDQAHAHLNASIDNEMLDHKVDEKHTDKINANQDFICGDKELPSVLSDKNEEQNNNFVHVVNDIENNEGIDQNTEKNNNISVDENISIGIKPSKEDIFNENENVILNIEEPFDINNYIIKTKYTDEQLRFFFTNWEYTNEY